MRRRICWCLAYVADSETTLKHCSAWLGSVVTSEYRTFLAGGFLAGYYEWTAGRSQDYARPVRPTYLHVEE